MIGLLERLAREVSGYGLTAVRRLFDRRPIQCSLFVTDRCDLDCAYCTEHDNSKPHPSLDDLKARLRKIRSLGTMRIALVGGEPLLHPDIVEIVRFCRELGLATSLTTNGFLLNRRLIQELDAAGLEVMQISVDRMTPSRVTRKSFETILPKLDAFRDSRIRLHVTGVICEDTLGQSREVLESGLERGIPTEIRLVHADPQRSFRVNPGDRTALGELLAWMIEAKRRGQRIHTTDALLNYQLGLVNGERLDWTCTAGYKIFFVSAEGRFQPCSMQPAERDILDVTPEDLYLNYRKKSCQDGCGVYCAVSASLLYERPFEVVGREIVARSRQIADVVRVRLGRRGS
jgi:MoaA/NifB/PqqE/SkfB family radical SAM enzyme